MVCKEAVVQVHFCIIKYYRADCIALNLPFSTSLVCFAMKCVTERDHILSDSLLTVRMMGITSYIYNQPFHVSDCQDVLIAVQHSGKISGLMYS